MYIVYIHYILYLYIYIDIYVYIRIFERDSPFLSKDEPEG